MEIPLNVFNRVACIGCMWGISAILSGCFIEPVCYNDADCRSDQFCSFPNSTASRPADINDTDSANAGDTDISDPGQCISHCRSDADCNGTDYCDVNTGKCEASQCVGDADCSNGFTCEAHYCKAPPQMTIFCPEGMVVVDQSFCIDIYEASRRDATEISRGADDSMALSRPGVMPWQVVDNAAAQAACESAGKTLCTADQWYRACIGPDATEYSYGNEYEAAACNGIDTFCNCESSACSESAECPFALCYHTCGANYHLMPTGSFPGCTNGYGVFDMNGNLWEHTRSGNDMTIRGGAYNCSDSPRLHKCSYVPGTWTPSARGFRCCADAIIESVDTDSSSESAL
ncbi:MAG: SUMF1/EgtB/PvdO family nonheme iron enzyme [Deltaproteobacteria bacterium]|nr:SUMF1/EgtB/PvdO family nonheme iron enzyme [Deltaproteobacteria bacterium]MBN2672096.1 SUMF1/EgtB/PvdO family nonheme iron enzyme [Deltaproteobacteria bacterium]